MNALRFDDFRFSIRRLRRDAGATMASVAALASGMGAAVATWSLISAVLLQPLPVAAPDRLFQVEAPPSSLNGVPIGNGSAHAYPVLEAIRNSGAFEGIAAGGISTMPVTEQGDVAQGRDVFFVSYDYFATLGINAVLGRTFAEDEDRRGAQPVAVLSDAYWRSVFNADPSVLGRTVTVSGTAVTIVGILPRGFRGLRLWEAPEIYLPLHVAADIEYLMLGDPLGPRQRWIRIVGRLRPGEAPAAVAAQLNALQPNCSMCGQRDAALGQFALTNVNTAALPDVTRVRIRDFTTLLSTTVGLLLLIGSLTVGMLLLVRTEDRRDELAVSLALGATYSRLASSIAVEAAIICTLASILAVPVALWLFHGLRAFQLPGRIEIAPLDLEPAPEAWLAVMSAAFVATFAIALLASLSGLRAAGRSPLRSRAVVTSRVTRHAPRTWLVAGQVAITLVLATGAGLFTRSLIAALSLNPGLETGRILTTDFTLASHGYTAERAATFFGELPARLRQNGAIASAAIMRSEGGLLNVTIDGVERAMPSLASRIWVDQNFFSTVGLPIVSGRSFARSHTADAPRVAVVSESLGKLIAGGATPIGHRITESGLVDGGSEKVEIEVIGVVPDLITDVNATESLAMYYPLAQSPDSLFATLLVRAAGDPRAARRDATATIKALDSRLAPGEMLRFDEEIRRQMNPQRFSVYVLGALGGIALLLTMLGTYVIAESMVVRRRREMSIRAALGAGNAHLRNLVLRDTARLVGIGLLAGLGLAVLGARIIRALLYRVEPLDPLVLATVSALIFGFALSVSLRPALQAARLDLTRSLREE